MTNLTKKNESIPDNVANHILNAHKYLEEFLKEFDYTKRGGVHDFMEITLFNMINLSIKNITGYIKNGHKEVNANEIIAITAASYQKVLDDIKRNLETMKPVNFKE